MRRWRSSAAYRIAFINFGAYAAGLALLGAIVFAVMHVAFTRQLDAMVGDEAQALAREFRTGGDRELAEAIAVREASSSPTHMMYAVYAPDGRRTHGSFPAARPSLGNHEVAFRDDAEGPDQARAQVIDLSATRRLAVAVDSDWLETIERIIILVFSIAFAGACAVGFGGAVLLGGYLRKRLRSITQSAEAIIGGDVRKRMPVTSRGDEFDQLANTLNRMLDRIEGLLENLRQVSSDVAHDLRTPLARLRNSLECAAFDGAEAAIGDAIKQVDEVLALFAAILRLAEVEGGETKRFFAPVNITALMTELAESYAPVLEDQHRSLLWSIAPDLSVEGDRELLAQAVVNLLENAQRHTPEATVVRLTAASAGQHISLQVADNGPGIPKSELGRVTKRFARLESSRNSEGYGLGLSLVAGVAKLHGGRLVLRTLDPGLSCTMDLPENVVPTQASRNPQTIETELE